MKQLSVVVAMFLLLYSYRRRYYRFYREL